MTEFGDKIKTLQFMGARSDQGSRVSEGRLESGERVKDTREGDPDEGYVTHREYGSSDRVDATVSPKAATIKAKAGT